MAATKDDALAAFFADCPWGLEVVAAVEGALAGCGPSEVRVTTSQVSFRRRRAFAFVWLPGRWLRHPGADVVLSIALDRHDPSPRWKQVAHPSAGIWMHHLEIHEPRDVDEQVVRWLVEAYACAGGGSSSASR